MALTLAQLEIISETHTRDIGTLKAQVGSLQLAVESLLLRVATLEAQAATQTTATVTQLERIADYQRAQANHYLALKSEALLP